MLAAVFLNHIDLCKLGRSISGLRSQQDTCDQAPSITIRQNKPDTILSGQNVTEKGPLTSTTPAYRDAASLQTGALSETPHGLPFAISTGISITPRVLDFNREMTDQAIGTAVKPELKGPAPVEADPAKRLLETLPVNDQKAAVAALKSYVSQQKDQDRAGSYDSLLDIAVNKNDMARVDLLLSMRSRVLKQPFVNGTKVLDSIMTTAAVKADAVLLNKLLDAHPHAHRDPIDRNVGTLALNFLRKIGSWFGNDAVAWQRKQGIDLLRAAARTANTATMTLLLGRAVDLIGDCSELEQALGLAMTAGNAESTAVLLKAVLHENPGYASNMIPATMAAQKGHGGVLEVLVSNGMVLPLKASWSTYAQPIEDYLRLKAADQQTPKGKSPARPLSRITLDDLVRRRSSLAQELRKSLNGKHEKLTKAQTACQHAGMVPDSGLAMITAAPFIAAGFAARTAAGLVDQLNSNAEFDFTERRVRPLLNLAGKVGEIFEYFLVEGKVRENLPEYLMEQGMYGLVADLVEAAIDSAAKSATWTMKPADREMLLAKALIETLGNRQNVFEEASKASGDPDLFAALLNSQLKILEAHQLPYFG